jgi:hypothetical protein
MAQVVECLSHEHEALSSNTNTAINKEIKISTFTARERNEKSNHIHINLKK